MSADPSFAPPAANTIGRADGGLDPGAPHRLLGQPSGTLGSLKQYDARSRRAILLIAGGGAVRWRALASSATQGRLRVRLHSRGRQCRAPRQASTCSPCCVAAAGSIGLPDRRGLLDLRNTLRLLPEAVPTRRAGGCAERGRAPVGGPGAGSALPATLIGRLSVMGADRQPWTYGTVSDASRVEVDRFLPLSEGWRRRHPPGGSSTSAEGVRRRYSPERWLQGGPLEP